MTEFTNDNFSYPALTAHAPDAHGEAAMLLVESLIHGLVERDVLSAADAVMIVKIAAEVREDLADERGDSPETTHRSLALLTSISDSLSLDA